MNTEPKSLHDALRRLVVLTSSVGTDIEKYLDDPTAYVGSEYFPDVLHAANEALHLVNTVRSLLKEENWRPQ